MWQRQPVFWAAGAQREDLTALLSFLFARAFVSVLACDALGEEDVKPESCFFLLAAFIAFLLAFSSDFLPASHFAI